MRTDQQSCSTESCDRNLKDTIELKLPKQTVTIPKLRRKSGTMRRPSPPIPRWIDIKTEPTEREKEHMKIFQKRREVLPLHDLAMVLLRQIDNAKERGAYKSTDISEQH